MKFTDLVIDKPVLVLANGRSLIEADQKEVQRIANKFLTVAINGAGMVKPDIRFFLDSPVKNAMTAQFCAYGKRGEKWAGRPGVWFDYKEPIDYEVLDGMAPWNNSFLACLWIVCSICDFPIYILGGDCNPAYTDEVVWSEDYSSTIGKGNQSQLLREHMQRMLDSSKQEIAEIERNFPNRLISLCGDYSPLPLKKMTMGEI